MSPTTQNAFQTELAREYDPILVSIQTGAFKDTDYPRFLDGYEFASKRPIRPDDIEPAKSYFREALERGRIPNVEHHMGLYVAAFAARIQSQGQNFATLRGSHIEHPDAEVFRRSISQYFRDSGVQENFYGTKHLAPTDAETMKTIINQLLTERANAHPGISRQEMATILIEQLCQSVGGDHKKLSVLNNVLPRSYESLSHQRSQDPVLEMRWEDALDRLRGMSRGAERTTPPGALWKRWFTLGRG